MKILIFGATGMLGNAMFRFISEDRNLTVYGTARNNGACRYFPEELSKKLITPVNIENHDSLIKLFATIKPDIVVNCIGLIKQLDDANNPLQALSINALLPHRLSVICQATGSRFIHISTDCVFSGSKGNYIERDFADANDLYGRSKFLGEVHYPNTITLRTSIIGHELSGAKSLVGWFLAQHTAVKGYVRAIFSGVPTVELARIVRDIVIPRFDMNGLYHVAAKPINKFDLLKLVASTYDKTIEIIPSNELVIDRSLNAELFNKATGYVPPEWSELIQYMYKFK
ncbi:MULTISPECIES: dTDP-4-dehydrorhamnose reductase family protein [unclassified Candidatus Tisiphia]|uniref:dTDP-4-dehydrorhamnose reductase family protein n=1 Tax=unclassified Candidatus Tisiphia TaxID=2996318 RepID=UPI00312C9C6F